MNQKVDEDVAFCKVLKLTGANNMVGLTYPYLPIPKGMMVPGQSPAHITGRQMARTVRPPDGRSSACCEVLLPNTDQTRVDAAPPRG